MINAQLEKAGHGPFTRQQMIYKLKKRGTYKDRTPPTDDPLEETD